MESPKMDHRQAVDNEETKDAAYSLQETVDLLQTVFDSAPNGIAIMHPAYNSEGKVKDFTVELFNAYTRNWIGDIEYKGKRYGELFPMVKPTGILERFIEVFETGTPAKFEQWYTGEGMKHWFRFTAVKTGGMLLITTEDITDRKQAEEMVHASEERLSNIINQVNAGIVQATINGKLINANERYCQITGYTVEELRALTVKDLTHPEDWPRNEELLIKALTEGKNFFLEKRYIRKDSSIVWVNNSVSIVTDRKGERFITAVSVDITDQITNRQRLEESESHFRLMADAIPEIIWVTDAKGKTEFFNRRWEEFSGVAYEPSTAAEVAAQYIHPDDAPKVMRAFEEAIAGAKLMEVEQRNRSASGEWCWFLNRATPYRNPRTGEVEKWFGISTDIDEQKKVGQALAESEARFRFAMKAGRLGSWQLDLASFTLHATDLCKEIFGQPLDIPFTYDTLRNTIHPDDRDVMKEAVEATLADGREYNIEYRIIRPDASLRWVNIRGQVQYNTQGVPVSMIGVSADITQQKMVQQALVESESKLRSMVMQSQTGICIVSGTPLRAEMVNDAFLAISGKSRQAFETEPYWDVLKEAAPLYATVLENVFRTGERFSVFNERIVLVRNGREETRYIDFNYEPLKDTNGNTTKVTVFATEVTEQVMARQKLEEKEKALEAALDQLRLSKEAAELGTFDLDLRKGTMHWDERCRVLFGINHQRPVSYETDFVGGLHPDDRERITKIIDNLFIKSTSDGNYDVEYRTVGQKDGAIRWVRAKGKVYFNSEDRPVRFIGSVLDITEQVLTIQKIESIVEERTKELELANESLHRLNEELQRSNANLEEFAHAASHDLKEPVRKISFFTHRLKVQLADRLTEQETYSFGRIENASKRMGNLIDDLLLYSHVSQRPHQMERVDLNSTVQHVLEDLELDIAEKKAIIQVGTLPVVQGHRRQLQQMFQNLISNALKYSKTNVPPRIDIAWKETSENGKRYQLIEIKDNGIGFAPEYADKIFQMFTRLHGKGEYSGTGVGLSIVKKVVENHFGFIRAVSTVGEGSVFKIYLPLQNL